MQNKEHIEAALQEPKQLLQVIPDIATFCGIADDNQYQARLFASLFTNSDFLLGVVKKAKDLDVLAQRYPAYKESLFQALLTNPTFYQHLVTDHQELEFLVSFYRRGLDSQEKGDRFLGAMIQFLILDEEAFLKVYHSPDLSYGDAIWRYEDQALICGTMKDFPEFEYELWQAELAFVIPQIYEEMATTQDQRYICILRDTIDDMVKSRMFDQNAYDQFESHATVCWERVSGDLKKELFYHLQFIANRKPLPPAELLVASTQQSLYQPVPDDHAQSGSNVTAALPQASVKGT